MIALSNTGISLTYFECESLTLKAFQEPLLRIAVARSQLDQYIHMSQFALEKTLNKRSFTLLQIVSNLFSIFHRS